MWWMVAACREGTVPNFPIGPVQVSLEPTEVGGTALLRASGVDAVVLVGDDDRRGFRVPPDGLEVVVQGLLPDTRYVAMAFDQSATLDTDHPDPELCPNLDVVADAPDAWQGKWLVVPHRWVGSDFSCSVVYDDTLRPRWWWVGEYDIEDVVFGVDGNLWFRFDSDEIEVRDPTGALLRAYTIEGRDGGIPLPLGDAHHELIVKADSSFWTFGRVLRDFEVPVRNGSEETEVRPVNNTVIQHVAADGTLLRSLDVLDDLEPGRGGFEALSENRGGADFLHGNALVVLDDDRVLVSLRNQDVHLMYGADNVLQWRFGDPVGWSSPWVDEFLVADGPVKWPYHSHGVDFDPATGELVVFDNRVYGGTPYRSDPQDDWSGVARYSVDEGARTVRDTGRLDQTATGKLRSAIMGDAAWPPGGPVLGTYAWVGAENDVPNQAAGYGQRTARIVTWAEDQPDLPLRDLRFWLPREQWQPGGLVFRSHLIEPLAP